MQDNLKQTFLAEIDNIKYIQELSNLKAKYIGKKGLITERIKQLGSLSPEEKKSPRNIFK